METSIHKLTGASNMSYKIWYINEFKAFSTKKEAEDFCIKHDLNFDEIKPLYRIES
jgi:hypothetical protein